ncbi:uncharacterized protein LOC133356904 isoform X2 [Lethenteron reissneri]|uniref:uncharacterized protein LOC133356904 isoform X2 n=1 Tax=Lethenteron reissneri TaxID=7753 RepID=UPI002AB6D90F|nr:uncharacterized protein LOC133356904 isoform X2 [Lethenteron reissneri]
MAASCSGPSAACLVALWAAVVSGNGNALAKHNQTFLLPCRTDCQGTGSDILWYTLYNNVWEQINSRKKEIGYTKYIDNKNASMTIEDPQWETTILHRCEWSCQEQRSRDKYTDTSIRLIKGVKTNNILEAKVGTKISIPCQGNSESRITGSVEWHFALPGQPFYPVNTTSGKKHSIDYNNSLLIHKLQKKDAGLYLCELNNLQKFYETKVNIIRDRPSSSTTPHFSSTTPSSKEGRSGVNLIPVYISVLVVCTAIACGAACYAWKQRKIRCGNKPDSTSNKGKHAYKSVKLPLAIYESIDPTSEPEPEQKYLERSKNQRSNTNSADHARSSGDVPPIVYDTVGAAQPEAALTCAEITINDFDVTYSVPYKSAASEMPKGTTMAHSPPNVHYAEVAIY